MHMTAIPIKVFIGYDSKEPESYHVLSHSILRRASFPVSITPLALTQLRHVYTRPRGPLESTEFSMTRFLVPYLSDYSGWSVFMDCDMLCRVDIAELAVHILKQPGKAVYCCQHDYQAKEGTKFLNQPQTVYPRKNWSSFMVFNNRQCQMLTPDYVNTATGLELHRMLWMPDDQIGSLPLEWNWLVGEYVPNPDAKVLHWTLGGPWFGKDVTHEEDWFAEREMMRTVGKA